MKTETPARSNRVLFITGAGSGIGLLTTKRALSDGWSVCGLDLNVTALEDLGAGDRLLVLQVDVTAPAQVNEAVDRAERELGPIDRVINAAAIMPLGLLNTQNSELITKVMRINYGGLVNVAQATLPRLVARRRGEFVSYASLAGHMPILYMGAYDASKFAVAAFTEVLYHENRNSGVRIVCVCPPPVATPLLKQAKETAWPKMFDITPPITPDDVIDAVEHGLKGSRLWIFPGPFTAIFVRLRRWFPSLTWWAVHRVEGR